jgi:phasin family protein
MSKARTQTENVFVNGDFAEVLDFAKIADKFKMPGVDPKAIVDLQKKNMEAVATANRVAFEGAQAVMRRQSEIVREMVENTSTALTEMAKPGRPEEKLAQQADLLKKIYETNLANMNELVELGAKSNREAAEVINHRVVDSIDEMKVALKTAASK